LETSGRKFILIKDDDGNRLAVQFNPGYIMHVSRKTTVERKETSQKGINTKRKSKKRREESQKLSEYEVPEGVQVIVLFDAGTKQLLGKPISNYLDQPDEELDTAVKCVEDDQLPD